MVIDAMSESDPYFVPTRGSQIKPPPHTTVVFEKHKKQAKEKPSETKGRGGDRQVLELDMKQARFDVYKFAKSAQPNPERQKSDFELAMRLGAAPPKAKAVSYPKLKEERRKLRQEAKEARQLRELGRVHRPLRFTNKRSHPDAARNRKKKVGSGILEKYGKLSKKN